MRTASTIAVLILATLLRFGHLRQRALDNDEIAEATWSAKSFAGMMFEVRRDAVHPPLDYLIQFVAGRIGPEWVRRLPSVIAGIGTVALMIVLGRWWISWYAGIGAAFLLAVSPMHIFYSQQVRPYSLALFFIVASFAALEAFARTRRRRWAAIWFLLVLLSAATLYFAGMIAALAASVRVFVGRRRNVRPVWRLFPPIAFAWILSYSPWFAVIRAASRIPSPSPRQSLDWLWWQWRLQSLGVGSDRTVETVCLASWTFWALVAGGVILSIRRPLLRVAAITFVIGTALEIALLQIHPHYPAVRYLMPSWIASFLLAGASLDFLLRHWSTRPIAITSLALFAGASAIKIDEYYRGDRSDWRAVALYVHDRMRPGDTLIVTSTWVIRNFGHYWHELPPLRDITIAFYDPDGGEIVGPAWIVTGGCLPRDAARAAPLMSSFPRTEFAEVRFLRPRQRMRKNEEICPN